jgi:hypothetical protein
MLYIPRIGCFQEQLIAHLKQRVAQIFVSGSNAITQSSFGE